MQNKTLNQFLSKKKTVFVKEDFTRWGFLYGRWWWFRAMTFPPAYIFPRHVAFSQWPQDNAVDPQPSTKPTIRVWCCHLTKSTVRWKIVLFRQTAALDSNGILFHVPHGKFCCKWIHSTVAKSARGIDCSQCWFTHQFTAAASDVSEHFSVSRCMWYCMA